MPLKSRKARDILPKKKSSASKRNFILCWANTNSLISQINDKESELRLVLQVKGSFIIPQLDSVKTEWTLSPSTYSLATLLDSAYKNRSDLLIARTTVEASKLNYNYQKSLAVPNLTLALAYDQQGSYIN